VLFDGCHFFVLSVVQVAIPIDCAMDNAEGYEECSEHPKDHNVVRDRRGSAVGNLMGSVELMHRLAGKETLSISDMKHLVVELPETIKRQSVWRENSTAVRKWLGDLLVTLEAKQSVGLSEIAHPAWDTHDKRPYSVCWEKASQSRGKVLCDYIDLLYDASDKGPLCVCTPHKKTRLGFVLHLYFMLDEIASLVLGEAEHPNGHELASNEIPNKIQRMFDVVEGRFHVARRGYCLVQHYIEDLENLSYCLVNGDDA